MRAPCPITHAHQRYFDPNAPHFVGHGMTLMQRHESWGNELIMMRDGRLHVNNMTNPILRGFFAENGHVYIGRRTPDGILHRRNMVNFQLTQLFQANNIIIPENMRLRFVIDSQYRLRVEGTNDNELARMIEEMMNATENSAQLFMHIIMSRYEENTQFREDSLRKYRLERAIRENTGYNLRDLQVVDGRFVTAEGIDVFEIFSRALFAEEIHGDALIAMIGYKNHIRSELAWLARVGHSNVPDLTLAIDFENGHLFDVGQKKGFGPGQMDWMDNLPGRSVMSW